MSIKKIKYELFKDKKFKDYFLRNELESGIAELIMVGRIEAGLTQEKLAKKAKLQQSSLGRIEAGNHLPNLKSLRKIAEGLNKKLIIKFI
jgi:DNA-binding XRE family transcriptional regulator